VREGGLGDAGADRGDAEATGVQRGERGEAGIRAPSKITWVVTSQARPIFFSGAPKLIPSVSAGTTKAESPRLASSEVRANRM
jgi:hypothetical protein